MKRCFNWAWLVAFVALVGMASIGCTAIVLAFLPHNAIPLVTALLWLVIGLCAGYIGFHWQALYEAFWIEEAPDWKDALYASMFKTEDEPPPPRSEMVAPILSDNASHTISTR